MARFVVYCPWCEEPAVFTGAPSYCCVCRHRADAAKVSCDCERCRSTPARERAFLARALAGDRAEHEEPTR